MATRISPPQNKTYYINPAYLTFVENSGYGANLIQVSASSSCYISVYDPANGIGYSDADRNYQRWKVTAYNNKFPSNEKFHIYVRLERSGTSALVIYDTVLRGVKGGEITVSKDENGNDVYTEAESTQDVYWYIKIGEVGETDGTIIREITYDTGYLESDQGTADAGDLNEMWELNKFGTPWLIKAKQWLQSFTVKGFLTLVGGLVFKKGETEKVVSDIKRSTDSDEDVPVSDDTIPTTKYVQTISDDRYLRKDQDDRSVGTIASDKGFVVGAEGKGLMLNPENLSVSAILDYIKNLADIRSVDFASGEFGNGFVLKYDKETGKSYFEVDEILVRKVAYFVELVIKTLSHVGGQIVLSPASMRCSLVEEYEEYYRCYFENERDGKTINQEFVVNDQARAQSFNVKEGTNQNVGNQYYWRLVVGIGDNYIDLSKIDCDEGSLPPQAGDDIVQLGNRTRSDRQNAIILSTVGDDAPSIKQYMGINGYTLNGKEVIKISPYGNVFTGDFVSRSGEDILGSIDDLGTRLDDVANQTDKTYMLWFYEYNPTLENYPSSEWIDDSVKREHLQDIFYNEAEGTAWRFLETSSGVFEWVEITDHETIKALEKAAKAQETADAVTEQLNEIVSDGILSALEKKEVLKEWETIVADYAINTTNAKAYGVDSTAYTNTYKALGQYLNGGAEWDTSTTPAWLADLTTNQEIVASDYRSKWISYYESEKDLLQAISDAIDIKAGNAQNSADEAQKTADSKIRNFVVQPTPPYDKGDRWSNATYTDSEGVVIYENDDLVCITSKTIDEKFDIADWQPTSSMNSEKAKVYASEFKRLDDKITSSVGEGSTTSEAIKAAQAAADAADAAAKKAQETANSASSAAATAQSTANSANKTATANATAITQTSDYVSLISAAFQKDDNGNLKLDDNGNPILTKAAGVVITSDAASLYATQTAVNTLTGRVAKAEAKIETSVQFDKDGNVVSDIKISADQINMTANDYISIINKGTTTISASRLNLVGSVTFSMFNSGLQDTINGKLEEDDLDGYVKSGEITADDLATSLDDLINGKADSDDLGVLAKKDKVSKDELADALKTLIDGKEDKTKIKGLAYYENVAAALDAQVLIAGGFVKADMIDVDSLVTKKLSATIDTGEVLDIDSYGITIRNSDDISIFDIFVEDKYAILRVGESLDERTVISKDLISCHNDTSVTYYSSEGVILSKNSFIRQFAVGNILSTLSSSTDFFIGSGNVILPDPSIQKGKVIFLKLTKSTTIKSSYPIYKGNEYSTYPLSNGVYSDSFSSRSLFFISDGTAWYEFLTYYRS